MPMRTVRRRRMVSPEPSRRPGTVWPQWPGTAGWGRALLALLPLGCVASGGATERWSEALMLLALGGVLLATPPRASLGRWMNLALVGLFLSAFVAFLPARWFFVPAWRSALTDDFGATLPTTLSPQPWLTAEAVVVFAAGLGWFYLMGTVRWSDELRRRAGIVFAAGTVALAVVAVAWYRAGTHPSVWPSERGFGPFPNRNQTADFFALGALPVLACGRAAWRAGHKPAALAWLAGWLAVAAAVFHSFSRAGVILLFATTAVYLGLEITRRTRHQPMSPIVRWRRIAMVASLVLVLGSGLLMFGGDTLARLRTGGAMTEGNTMSNALRRAIYADTAGMIARSPWCGSGLNTFNEIFATYRREAVQNPQRVKHPESDWLWLAAELGWPGVVAALAGVGLTLRRMRPPRHGHDRPLRLAAAIGVAGFLAHGLVDVGGHRVGTVFSALFLLGLALPGRALAVKPEEETADLPADLPWLGWMFRGAGVLFVGVGLLWTLEARGVLLLPGDQGVAALKNSAVQQGEERDFKASRGSLTRALAWSPLDWRTYYMRGAAGVLGGDQADEALADFRRARYLEGVNAALPFDEARVWASAGQVAPAVSALLEACRRDPANAVNYLRVVYAATRLDEDFVARVGAAARRDPALTVALVAVLEPPDTAEFIESVLRADPALRKLDDTQKARFFQWWALRGDPRSLVAEMDAHPDWQGLGWRSWADAKARDGTPDALRAACGIAARFAPRAQLPPVDKNVPPPAELRRSVETGEPGLVQIFALYAAERAAGDVPGALETLQRATARPDCPAYFYYLEATLATETGRWELGWPAWQKYLSAVPVGR